MAPITPECDLLDSALKNKTILPSWRSIFTRITTSPAPSLPTLSRISTFLAAPSSRAALLACHDPFPPPSAASKADFEKRTAAINFTAADAPDQPAAAGSLPPIAELKDAALELSRTLNIDEVSALRIVVLERQKKPAKELLAAQGGDGEFGNVGALGSSLRVTDLQNTEEDKIKTLFERVELYLCERRYVIKVAAVLVRAALCADDKKNVWSEAGRKFVEDALGEGNMMESVVESIDKRWRAGAKNREGLPEWVRTRTGDGTERGQQVAYAWQKQTLTETIHLLQLLFLLLYRPADEVTATLVMTWFKLMQDSGFLSHWIYKPLAGNREIENLYVYCQGLVSIVSLTVLQLPKALDCLRDEFKKPSSQQSSVTPPATGPASPPRTVPTISDKAFYIKHPTAIKVLTECILATMHHPGSSLAATAFVCIIDHLHRLVEVNTDWSDDEGIAPKRGSGAVNLYSALLPELFPTTVQAGLLQIARVGFKHMLTVATVLLEPSEQTSAGVGFALHCEEDGLRMKNVLAHMFRKTQTYGEFSGSLVAVAFLVADVEYTERSEFRQFLEHDAAPERSAAAMLLDHNNDDLEDDWSGSPARKFWQDPGAAVLLDRAKNRFPYEPLLFLQTLRGHATENTAATEYLTSMNSYTQELPPRFKEYEGVGDDDDDEVAEIQLTADLTLFAPRSGSLFDDEMDPNGVYTSLGGIVIPAGTHGIVTSTGGGRTVVAWQFQYNALPMLGRVLECALSSSTASLGDLGSTEGVTEIVALLTMLIASSREFAACEARLPGHYGLPQVLEDASDILGRNKDVVSIIFDLLDSALNRAASPDPFFIAGLQFVDSLVHISPQRVWPYLARSALLERHGRGGAFARILTSVETVRGTYEITLTCLGLFESLVEEAIRSAAQHSASRNSKSLVLASASKQPHRTGTGALGVSDSVQRDILAGFTRVAVDIFESYRGYKYIDIAQKLALGTKLARIFTRILDYVYGVDESAGPGNAALKLTGVLAPSAEHLVSVFLSAEGSELPLEPILGALSDGVHTPESSLYLRSLTAWITTVTAVVDFSDILVRVRLYLALPPSQLEKRLYAAAPALAKLYAADERYRVHVLELLESLVKAAGSHEEEPPSLLGHLGSECANHLVTLLGALDAPYDDVDVETRIWDLVAAVVSCKQQGMSILLLRGETLRSNGAANKTPKKKSMLSLCLDALVDLDRLPVAKALAMLNAVATAQNFWSLAMSDLGAHPRFLSALTKHIETLTIEFLPADTTAIHTEKAQRIAVAAHIARILALYFHARRASTADAPFFQQLLPRLNFYFTQAVKITGYRASLHAHLQHNFEAKWPGVKLSQIRKTRLRRPQYGADAFYDVTLGSAVLGGDPAWDGGRADSYRAEVAQANVNLCVVQAQVSLLEAWTLLATELTAFAAGSPELAAKLVDMAAACLRENIAAGLPAPIFAHIVQQRAEFAFVVVRRLHVALERSLALRAVFDVAWKAIHSNAAAFRAALAAADMGYYRSVLRILYLALTSLASDKPPPSEFAFTVLNLLDLVVAKGFTDLATAAHAHPARSNPQDIALLTAILQAALRLHPNMAEIHSGLSAHLADAGTVRAATTLFSWAPAGDAEGDGAVYADLAARFLLELSTAPVVAEHLAVEGTLNALTASHLCAHLAVAPAPLPPRLHAIWARALLPLALTLLATIGARVGREIAAFLVFFRARLRAALAAWAKPEHVLLANVEEGVNVAMILALVGKLGGRREVEALEVGGEVEVAEEGVAYLLAHRNYLGALVVAGTEEEEGMGQGLVERVEEGLRTVAGLLEGEEE